MTINSTSDAGHDRDARLRFMRINDETGVLLREFWKIVEPALPGSSRPSIDMSHRSRSSRA